jgi:TonB family protein
MRAGPGSPGVVETERQTGDLRLLVVRDSRAGDFLENFRELFRAGEKAGSEDQPGDFWRDVFVEPRMPWLRFLQSGAFHLLAIALIWAGSRILALQPRVAVQPPFTHDEVVYDPAEDSLPPIDTRQLSPARQENPEPELSAQPIISLPREAENRTQTIVTPPKVKLRNDIALPNVIAWSETSETPIGPAPVVMASEISRLAPNLEQSIVAPPPDVEPEPMPQDLIGNVPTAVIAPPPTAAESMRRLGDINIVRSAVIAPAPQLSVEAQRPGRAGAQLSGRSLQVIAPPPSVGASGRSRAGANMIALNLHPALAAPVPPVAGNRRGSFATTPAGHHGATGAAAANGAGKANGTKAAGKSVDLPEGLYVGKNETTPSTPSGDGAAKSNAYTVNPNLIASARPPRVSARRLQPEAQSKLSDEERAVFGDRKFYSLSLNMPNLNSAGGSWIIRFAALKQDSGSSESYVRAAAGGLESAAPDDLSAPSAVRKIDPAYPLELMRQNVGGTVILYAVIRRDGTVGNIRVLRSVDERLDRYASQAVAKWQFEPATKDGTPVEVEATFWIPFRPVRQGTGF